MRALLLGVATSIVISTNVFAANYSYIDPGDSYYINDWGSENRLVTVVRKLGNDLVKVRDYSTGETSNVRASALLTKSELQAEETGNKMVGTAIGAALVYCIFAPEECKDK